MREYRVTTTWNSGGSTVHGDLDYTSALDLVLAHEEHGHTCKVEVREVGPWETTRDSTRAAVTA